MHGFLFVTASLIAEHGVENLGSVAVAHGLSWSVVYGLFQIRDQTPEWKVDSQPLAHQGGPCGVN